MLRLVFNVAVSLTVIAVCSYLVKRWPNASGFVTALPITTMLVLFLSHLDGSTPSTHAKFATSLLAALPLSATFLVPFALAPRLGLSFWSCFGLGLALLALGYGVHRAVIGAD